MSEVLTRSLATSFTTLLAIMSLFIFGGATLQDFAFAMAIGILSGTYSSIFIASPVLTSWKEREPSFARRRERMIELEGSVPPFADDVELAKLDDDSETDVEIEDEIAAEAEPQAAPQQVATVEPEAEPEPERDAESEAADERRRRDAERRERRQKRRKHGRNR